MEPCSEKSLVGIGIENESERRRDDLALDMNWPGKCDRVLTEGNSGVPYPFAEAGTWFCSFRERVGYKISSCLKVQSVIAVLIALNK
jgi:hypothetical protein